MAKDRAYKYGWHPDRPQDAERRARGGDDVVAPEGSVDGWVTTTGFSDATRIRRSDVSRAARLGAIRGEKRGGRWYIAPEELERWAALTVQMTAEVEAEGYAVGTFFLAIEEHLHNVGTSHAPEYRKIGYRAWAAPIYDMFQASSHERPTEPPAIPPEPSERYVQYRDGLRFVSRRPLTDEELDLGVKHRRAMLDRDPAHDIG